MAREPTTPSRGSQLAHNWLKNKQPSRDFSCKIASKRLNLSHLLVTYYWLIIGSSGHVSSKVHRPYFSSSPLKVIEKLKHKFPRLKKILADGGYQGSLGDWVADKFGWVVEVVLRPDECPSKFRVLPKRWIVERTFSMK